MYGTFSHTSRTVTSSQLRVHRQARHTLHLLSGPYLSRPITRNALRAASVLVFALLVLFGGPTIARAADITVNSDDDTAADDGVCTLREALEAANNDTASGATLGECAAGDDNDDTILFDIGGGGQQTIQPTSHLPAITEAVVISGTSQSGASCAAWPPSLLITLNGSAAGADGLTLIGNGATVQGLVIQDFTGMGIRIEGDNHHVWCNFIGTDHSGTTAIPNTINGVMITFGASDNIVGTDGDGVADEAERNLISGNGFTGVYLTGTTSNRVAGNLIGTDLSGTTALPNFLGVVITGGASNNILGTNGDGVADEAERNLISGNGHNGVGLDGAGTNGNRVAGNYIGTDLSGTTAIPNYEGVYVDGGASENIIGTNGDGVADVAERNLISGNGDTGVWLNGAGTDSNTVAGNYIGTNLSGTSARPNIFGVFISNGASDNIVGTNGDGVADEAERNLISGNGESGVYITGPGTTSSNTVAGNFIGTDLSGTAALSNLFNGVFITNGASDNIVGTNGDGVADVAERNLISGNGGSGVWLTDVGTTSNTVAGNYIGTDLSGAVAIPNSIAGVDIFAGANDNIVGTNGDGVADEAERNLISGNGGAGIRLFEAGTTGNTVAGNTIGTNLSGTEALPNTAIGLVIAAGASDNVVGTNGDGVTDGAEGNLISGNGASGVYVTDAGTTNNTVAGNYIGTDLLGTVAIPNAVFGIEILAGASDNIVGTNGDGVADEAEGNLISGNGASGVFVSDAGTTGNRVAGNYIGTDLSGTAAIPNTFTGIVILAGASNNIIGTNGDGVADAAERNLISGNADRGVRLANQGTDSNRVAGNYIGTDLSGTAAIPNTLDGVFIDQGARANIVGTNGDGIADEAERNLISGNGFSGVSLTGAATTSNTVAGNYIGTDLSGAVAIPNTLDGVLIATSASGNIVGTNGDGVADEAERNLISGNGDSGISLNGVGTTGNRMAGNFIGTDLSGTTAISNSFSGVRIFDGASDNIVGTNGDGVADEAERNLISGNGFYGVALNDAGTTSNTVAGNYIGTDLSGTAAIPNALNGVLIDNGASDNIVGTNGDGVVDEAERNLISGNRTSGVFLSGAGTSNNRVAGNLIGTDPSGTAAISNIDNGVLIAFGASDNSVGTNADGVADEVERNLISGNGDRGVWIALVGTTSNTVAGNYIGTDLSGTTAIPNANGGVVIFEGGSDNIIGTNGDGLADEVERNLISGNGGNGIQISDVGTTGNHVAGNYIGTDLSGTTALPNTSNGVVILAGASETLIGTNGDGIADESERNLISGNGDTGVFIANTDTTGNRVAGNYIGTDLSGTTAIANVNAGVRIDGASDNIIGTNGDGIADEAERNLISGNANDGVQLSGAGTFPVSNTIASNTIFGNGLLGIDLEANGVTPNDEGDSDDGSNRLQNFPLLNEVLSAGGQTFITGTLNSQADTQYRIQFFANDTAGCDASGYGEGESFLGEISVTTNGSGKALFAPTVATAVAEPQFVTATAIDPAGNTSEFSPCGPLQPAIVLTKTVGIEPNQCSATDAIAVIEGTQVTYCYIITNTGNVTLTVEVEDDHLGSLDELENGVLAPQETRTVTRNYVTQLDDAATPLVNTVTVTGTYIVGTEVTGSDSATVTVIPRVLELEVDKKASATQLLVGETITYTYRITNTSNVTLTAIEAVDDRLDDLDELENGDLAPQETRTTTRSYVVVEDDLPGPLVNTVTVTGTDNIGNVVTGSDNASVNVIARVLELEVDKSANRANVLVGEEIIYTYRITNTGNVILTTIEATDDRLGVLAELTGALGPQESRTALLGTVVPGDDGAGPLVNTVIVTGTDSLGDSTTGSDSASVAIVLPVLSWAAHDDTVNEGDTFSTAVLLSPVNPYSEVKAQVTITFSNESEVRVAEVREITFPPGSSSQTVVVDVPDDDEFQPRTMLLGLQSPSGAVVGGSNGGKIVVEIVDDDAVASLQVTNIANTNQVRVGDTITYTYRITNTGNVTLTTLVAQDTLNRVSIAALVPELAGELPPQQSRTAAVTYVTQPADTAAPLVNNLVVTGTDALGGSVTGNAAATVIVADPTNLPEEEQPQQQGIEIFLPRIEN